MRFMRVKKDGTLEPLDTRRSLTFDQEAIAVRAMKIAFRIALFAGVVLLASCVQQTVKTPEEDLIMQADREIGNME
jgi:hypothetical protein